MAGNGVGVTVGRAKTAGAGITTTSVVRAVTDSSDVVETSSLLEMVPEMVPEMVWDSDKVADGAKVTESAAVMVATPVAVRLVVSGLEGGPTRAWGATGGGVSGTGERIWVRVAQFASKKIARINSARLLNTVRDNIALSLAHPTSGYQAYEG